MASQDRYWGIKDAVLRLMEIGMETDQWVIPDTLGFAACMRRDEGCRDSVGGMGRGSVLEGLWNTGVFSCVIFNAIFVAH